MDWIEVANKFGIPFMFLLGTAVFVVRYVWPFCTNQIWPFIIKQIEDFKRERETERQQFLVSMDVLTKERQAERLAFLAAMDSRDKQFAPVVESLDKLHDLVSARMDNVTAALNRIETRKR